MMWEHVINRSKLKSIHSIG